MILPLPEQEKLEREIHDLFEAHRGSIETVARYLRKDVSNISRQLNPFDPNRLNPFYGTLEILWALDIFCPVLSDEIWEVLEREREKWRVNAIQSTANMAKLLDRIIDEFKDVIHTSVTNASIELKEKELYELRRAIDEKLEAIKQIRGENLGMQ